MSDYSDTLLKALLRNDRHAGLGVLTSSVVHAVNNHFGAILGYSELLQMNPASAVFKNELEQIIQSCTQGIDLVRNLALVRNHLQQNRGGVDLTRIVKALTMILGRLHNSQGIKVECGMPDTLLISSRSEQLTQATYHLLQMAYKSVGELPVADRRLTVSLLGDSEAGSIKVEAPQACFRSPDGREIPPAMENPAYNWWMLRQVCNGELSFESAADGGLVEVSWRMPDSGV